VGHVVQFEQEEKPGDVAHDGAPAAEEPPAEAVHAWRDPGEDRRHVVGRAEAGVNVELNVVGHRVASGARVHGRPLRGQDRTASSGAAPRLAPSSRPSAQVQDGGSVCKVTRAGRGRSRLVGPDA
jgi:hypothetical protein